MEYPPAKRRRSSKFDSPHRRHRRDLNDARGQEAVAAEPATQDSGTTAVRRGFWDYFWPHEQPPPVVDRINRHGSWQRRQLPALPIPELPVVTVEVAVTVANIQLISIGVDIGGNPVTTVTTLLPPGVPAESIPAASLELPPSIPPAAVETPPALPAAPPPAATTPPPAPTPPAPTPAAPSPAVPPAEVPAAPSPPPPPADTTTPVTSIVEAALPTTSPETPPESAAAAPAPTSPDTTTVPPPPADTTSVSQAEEASSTLPAPAPSTTPVELSTAGLPATSDSGIITPTSDSNAGQTSTPAPPVAPPSNGTITSGFSSSFATDSVVAAGFSTHSGASNNTLFASSTRQSNGARSGSQTLSATGSAGSGDGFGSGFGSGSLSDGAFGGSTATGSGGAGGTARPDSNASSNNNDSSTASTPVIVGSVVGSLAGFALLLLLLLVLLRWYKRRTLGATPPGEDPSRALGVEDPFADPPQAGGGGGTMTQHSSAFFPAAVAGAFTRMSRHRPAEPAPAERGFQRISGRKLPSAFSPGMEALPAGAAALSRGGRPQHGPGFGDGGDAMAGVPPGTATPYVPAGAAVAGGGIAAAAAASRDRERYASSTYTADHAAAAAATIPPLGSAPTAPDYYDGVRDSEVLLPSPARTPMVQHPILGRFSHVPGIGHGGANSPNPFESPPSTPTSPVRAGTLGRSLPSADGSRGSRFTEDVG